VRPSLLAAHKTLKTVVEAEFGSPPSLPLRHELASVPASILVGRLIVPTPAALENRHGPAPGDHGAIAGRDFGKQ